MTRMRVIDDLRRNAAVRMGLSEARETAPQVVPKVAVVNARSAAVDARLARVRAEIDLARLDGRAPFQGAQ